MPPGTLAAALLERWLAPLKANRAPAATPLLVVGQSAWAPVAHSVADSVGQCYPVNFPRISREELLSSAPALLRANAHGQRVINVGLESVEAAAALAPALGRIRDALPHHSICFFSPAPPEGLPGDAQCSGFDDRYSGRRLGTSATHLLERLPWLICAKIGACKVIARSNE